MLFLKTRKCHYDEDDPGDYGVPSVQGGVLLNFDPSEEYQGKSWSENNGWAERFIENDTKPDTIKMVIRAWIEGDHLAIKKI